MEQTLQKVVRVSDESWVTIDIYGNPAGNAIIMLPGVMSDSAAWAAVASALKSWQTVLVVNRRGRAPSGPLGSRYSLDTEVGDLTAVLQQFPNVEAVFGWSYGGLIALNAANSVPMTHVVAYEPIIRPFALTQLPALEAAHDSADWARTVEVVAGQIAGMDAATLAGLRADTSSWAALEALSESVFLETAALNSAPLPDTLANCAQRIDLIIGGRNQGRPPYGTAFENVRSILGRAAKVHTLEGQGHMAHLESPTALAALIDQLGVM